MRYIIDHDLHIHSYLSLCSKDEQQNPTRILEYAKKNDFKKVCLTDHFWDESVDGGAYYKFYALQGYKHISQILPLPKDDSVEFLFGCETEIDKNFQIGVSKRMMEKFDFIIVPTTHMHMSFTVNLDAELEERAEIYVKRLESLLKMDLPFEKIGIAHLTCPLLAPKERRDHITVLDMVSDEKFRELFLKAKEKGAGIELNFNSFDYSERELESVLRPYKIASECGCKFYFGSDAHHPDKFEGARANFENIIDLLELKEEQKFQLKNQP